MKKFITIVFIGLFLAGCGSVQELRKDSALISDAALDVSVWGVCNATTVGALYRRYGGTDKMDQWKSMCDYE